MVRSAGFSPYFSDQAKIRAEARTTNGRGLPASSKSVETSPAVCFGRGSQIVYAGKPARKASATRGAGDVQGDPFHAGARVRDGRQRVRRPGGDRRARAAGLPDQRSVS